jgi:hypothetical protein
MLLGGCAGVPRLYRPDRQNPQTALAPKVDDIIHQIACELQVASNRHLKGRNYIITVFLNLQVDDALHITPSLSFINPFERAGTSSTILEAADLGGERRRTFTTTLFLESKELIKGFDPSKPCNDAKLYRLDGELGLSEIVRDGAGAYLVRYGDRKIHPDVDKTFPLFGSTILFAVNRTVSALGPIWTFKRFKGPGGNAGLLNGKVLNTDSLTITFSLQSNDVGVIEAALQRLNREQGLYLEAASGFEKVATANVAAQERAVTAQKVISSKGRKPANFVKSAEVKKAEADIAAAQQAGRNLEGARAALDAARLRLNAAKSEAADTAAKNEQPTERAVDAGQRLLNTMILQNLNVQPR